MLGEVRSLVFPYLSVLKRRKLSEILNGGRKMRKPQARENKWWNARSKFTSNTSPPEILGIFVNTAASPKSQTVFRILNIVPLPLLSAQQRSYFKSINPHKTALNPV